MQRQYTDAQIARFWEKVDRSGDCWIWTASRRADGSGQFGINHRPILARRMAWELTHGPIPDGVWIRNECGDRRCCNPSHHVADAHQLPDRFWANVEVGEGCWEWQAFVHPSGYGVIGVGRSLVAAHRYSWELANGPIPEGLFVCHHCDNRRCVRPDHLFLGTHRDNMTDRDAKGRVSRVSRNVGSAHPHAVLNEAVVRDMRLRHAAGERVADLAREFGVDPETARYAINGRTWRHVD